MKIVPYSNIIDDYLKNDNVIDYESEAIVQLADTLFQKANNALEFIKIAYEFVRDNISHSADINEDIITCTASEVLKAGHGICFAKSHLLAAVLRCKSIPTGFCYQKIILDDETAPVLVYHGLNGVYVKELKKWIRLDARGNKNGVNAQFSIETEQLAYPIRSEMGEVDGFVIFPEPDIKILEKLRENKTRTELWNSLPTELGYNTIMGTEGLYITKYWGNYIGDTDDSLTFLEYLAGKEKSEISLREIFTDAGLNEQGGDFKDASCEVTIGGFNAEI